MHIFFSVCAGGTNSSVVKSEGRQVLHIRSDSLAPLLQSFLRDLRLLLAVPPTKV